MTTRIQDLTTGRLKVVHPKLWSPTREAWEEARGFPKGGMVNWGSPMNPYLGEGTIWQRSVASMPLHANSAALANWMWTQTPTRFKTVTGTPSGAFGSKTSFNTSASGTAPIVTCVVDSTDPYCEYQYIDSVTLPEGTTAERDAFIQGRIPWPMGFLPPTGGDKAMAIFDLGTGITREYFGLSPVANKPGHWTATTGGFSVANPHYRDFDLTNYATQLQKGSSAVALMHNSLGFVGIDEVRNKRINHALAVTLANATGGIPASWPAVWSDGKFPPAEWSGWAEQGGANGNWPGESPRHGQWGRLPMSVDTEYNPRTGFPYNPLTKLLIKAAQEYGFVGTDTNAWCHSFNAESGARDKMLTGVDPWATNGELATHLHPASPSTAFDVSDFPWDLTEWAPIDWGRPNPDFRLRPNESFPVGTSVAQVVRTNDAVNPRASQATGFLPNSANWTVARNQAVPATHPQGITTCAKSTVANVAAGNDVLSMYDVDGKGNWATFRGAGAWVYSPKAATARFGTELPTTVPANTWTFVKRSAQFTGYSSLYITQTVATVVGDVAYVTGVIVEAGALPQYFFDGSIKTPQAMPYLQTYAWLGGAGASASTETTPAHIRH